jgi:CPA2 family monovalent cation:H+ antiporter-2
MFAAIAGDGGVANRLGQSVIPFYIVAGMLLSEFVLGRIALPVLGTAYVPESEFIATGAELGIVFLLFRLRGCFGFATHLPRQRAGLCGR